VRRLSTSAACDTCKPLSLFAILRAAGAVHDYTIAFINCRRLDTLAIALSTLKWPLDRGNSVSDPRCSDRSVAHIIFPGPHSQLPELLLSSTTRSQEQTCPSACPCGWSYLPSQIAPVEDVRAESARLRLNAAEMRAAFAQNSCSPVCQGSLACRLTRTVDCARLSGPWRNSGRRS
jgi:hypothetical protein